MLGPQRAVVCWEERGRDKGQGGGEIEGGLRGVDSAICSILDSIIVTAWMGVRSYPWIASMIVNDIF